MSRSTAGSSQRSALLTKARRLLDNRLYWAANEAARALLVHWPNDFDGLQVLAYSHVGQGEMDKARPLLAQCRAMRPTDLICIGDLARVNYFLGETEQVLALCDDGLRIEPSREALLTLKAAALGARNQPAQQLETLAPLLIRPTVGPETCNLASQAMLGLGRHDESLQWADRGLQAPRMSDVTRRELHFQRSKVFDRMGRFDEAFAACEAAHSVRSRTTFEPEEFKAYVSAVMHLFSRDALHALARSNRDSQVPVFVIGMPRSGTTLVEQIIHSHPKAYGAGELADIGNFAKSMTTRTGSMHAYPDCLVDLTPKVADEYADEYLSHLRSVAGDATRVVNKAVRLYEHVGLISLLFPKSRVVHIRRDPMDTCLSCFTRHLNPDHFPWVQNLEHAALVYRLHEQLMDHWASVLDIAMLSLRYEDLVADQAGTTRRIIDFLGLPWDERCLRYWEADRTVMTLSFDQVNQPIYTTSMGRWRRYEKHLGPLKAALEADGARSL